MLLLFQILSERGYIVRERGVITVKGKGDMRTFFILGRKISRGWRRGGSGAGNNSLAEVVYGMVRARRRRTLKKGELGEQPSWILEGSVIGREVDRSQPIRYRLDSNFQDGGGQLK